MKNKILGVILGVLLLNLSREYVWEKPVIQKNLYVAQASVADFDTPKRDWSYYADIFSEKNMPVYSYDSTAQVKVPLRLALRGTIISSPMRSFAIIEDLSTRKQDIYGLGDTINGAKIVSMERNNIVLDCGGVKQDLEITDELLTPQSAEVVFNSSPSLQVYKAQEKIVLSDTVPKIKDAFGDFTKILAQLRIKPYFENGKCVGFQLNNINNNFIRQMGLKDGDIVESINGVKIDDPLKALQILYGLDKNNPVHLSVDRGDEQVELDCKVEG